MPVAPYESVQLGSVSASPGNSLRHEAMACGPSTPSALLTPRFAEWWRIESPERRQFQPQPPSPVAPAGQPSGPAGWFQSMKPYCNSVEVETMMRQTPAPAGMQGAGYGAACYALAGRIDQARVTNHRPPRR